MLKVTLDETNGIATLEPDGTLSEADFIAAAAQIDPYLERNGDLKGLIIHARSFPGWNSFGALLSHLRFVKDHQQRISHVALVTDSALGGFAEQVVGHFVAAQVRHFGFDEIDAARAWILGRCCRLPTTR